MALGVAEGSSVVVVISGEVVDEVAAATQPEDAVVVLEDDGADETPLKRSKTKFILRNIASILVIEAQRSATSTMVI